MFSSQSIELDLDIPCRCLTELRADKLSNRFLAGSFSIQHLNSLYLLKFDSELNELTLEGEIPHDAGSIQEITASPTDMSLVLTVAEQQSSVTLWKLPSSSLDGDSVSDTEETLEEVTRIEIYEGSPITSVDWRDNSDDLAPSTGDVSAVDRNGRVTRWDIAMASSVVDAVQASEGNENVLDCQPRVSWDPHGNGDFLAVSRGTKINVIDWRAEQSVPSGIAETITAHRFGICDIDYNPNKPYVLASSGQDGLVKYWDLRAAKHPLLVSRGGHSHWVSNVKYNPSHDQLVLTAGTDSISNLWRVSTISSAPLLAMDDEEENGSETAPNIRVKRHEHSESIYSSCWGVADPWVYASLSYDGKVVVNQVPSKEKYKILL